MSFTAEKRLQIKHYLLEKIASQQKDYAKKTAEAFGISLNTVYRYIKELEKEEAIEKSSKTYTLKSNSQFITLSRSHGELFEEDKIYDMYVHKYIENLPDNVQKIWQYSFMEMMNNAIDHSEAEKVVLYITQNYMTTTIMLIDDGIGIFHKIKDYFHYDSLDDAVNELFKGKLTTDSNNHSGEGIFFTSRVLDSFGAISDGKIFAHNKYNDVLQNTKDALGLNITNGTLILMGLSNFSNKNIKEIFDMYADIDGGFVKTHIPIKNIYETYPVSRSQAKRLCQRFDKFREIELDFNGVDEIGQGFAHEIFVVWQNKHKDIKLIPTNLNPSVEKMISHVKQTNI